MDPGGVSRGMEAGCCAGGHGIKDREEE